MIHDEDREALIEMAASVFRPRDANGALRGHPAWHDLDTKGRTDALSRTISLRPIEASLDPDGLSTTARAVLARLRPLR